MTIQARIEGSGDIFVIRDGVTEHIGTVDEVKAKGRIDVPDAGLTVTETGLQTARRPLPMDAPQSVSVSISGRPRWGPGAPAWLDALPADHPQNMLYAAQDAIRRYFDGSSET